MKIFKSCLKLVVTTSLVAFFVYAFMGLTRAVPSFGSVDFFYYICTSRDKAQHIPSPQLASYFYFPGVLVAWSSLMKAGGFDLQFLQKSYLIAITLNAFLVGGIALLLTDKFWCCICAATLYIFSAAYTEGVEGCTEIFCTIPFLFGILVWILLTRRGYRYAGMLTIGFFAAITFFMKQQALLLLVGGLGFLPLMVSTNKTIYLKARHVLLATIAFISTFFGLFFLEGSGVAGLMKGLSVVQGYEQRNSFSENLLNLSPLFPFSGFVLVSLMCWLLSLLRVNTLDERGLLRSTALGVCLIGGMTSLYQFKTRGYLHYALLTDPCFALVCSLAIFYSLQVASSPSALRRLVPPLVFSALCWAPLLTSWEQTLGLWRSIDRLKDRPTAEESMQRYKDVCNAVPPNTELFLFPPRRNIIHWFCFTRSTIWPQGYGWGDVDIEGYKTTLSNPQLRHVFVQNVDSVDYNMPMVMTLRGAPFEDLLRQNGFRNSIQLSAGNLFIR